MIGSVNQPRFPFLEVGIKCDVSRTHLFEQLLVYLFKSNSLGSIHLNPPFGGNLDFA